MIADCSRGLFLTDRKASDESSSDKSTEAGETPRHQSRWSSLDSVGDCAPVSRSVKVSTPAYCIGEKSERAMSCCSHDFLSGRRIPKWARRPARAGSGSRRCPSLYVDDWTLLELVDDVTQLRRGDHCLSGLNCLRTLNPLVDYLHSWLCGYGFLRIYHHFIVLQDVCYVDSNGVPRTEDGSLVEILEYSNTATEFIEDMKETGFVHNFLNKAKCRKVPLVDYGDMPHIQRVVEERSETERAAIVKRSLEFASRHPRYHLMHCNCEHTTNHIKSFEHSSPQVSYLLSNLLRYVAHWVGVAALWHQSRWFHVLTTGVVAIQLLGSFIISQRSIAHHASSKAISASEARILRSKLVAKLPLIPLLCYRLFRFIEESAHLWLMQRVQNYSVFASAADLLLTLTLVCHVFWFADVLICNSLFHLVSHAVEKRRHPKAAQQ